MALFGSRSDGSGSQPRGRKPKRRWTPEPGAAQAKPWREAAAPTRAEPTRVEHRSAPPPTRVERPVPPPPPRGGYYGDPAPHEAPTTAQETAG